jgi:hypothetical protein
MSIPSELIMFPGFLIGSGLAAYAGYMLGRAKALKGLRYEHEVYECKSKGLFKKQTILKIRERTVLDGVRLAEVDRHIVLTSEVDKQAVLTALAQGCPLLAALARIAGARIDLPSLPRSLAGKTLARVAL